MGNYRFDDNLHEKKRLPAGQRGVGCIMMVLLPIISYVTAGELLKIKAIRHFFYKATPSLFGKPAISKMLWEIKSIVPFLLKIYSWTDVKIKILLGLIVLLALSAVFGFIYAIIYNAVTPSRYSGLDAPPPKRRATKKSR